MKMKKILASVSAAALAVSAMSVCALASEPVKKPESYEKPPVLISADTALPDTIYGPGVKVTFNLTVNDVNGGWANGSVGIIADGEILKDAKFGGTECDADSNRSWFPEGSVVIEEGQKTATVVCEADLTGKSGFNIFIFSGQPTDAADNGFFTLDSATIKNDAGFEATYADGTLTITGGAEAAPAGDTFTANLETALYVGESVTWVTAKSDSVTITGEGDYTYSISDLDIAPEALTVIYIKDVAVENGNATTSDIAPIKITYKSLKINGEEVAVKEGAPDGLNEKGVFDVAFYNIWDENYIDAPTANINSVELTINVAAAAEEVEATEATEKATEEATEAPESTTEAAPAETTAAPAETTAAPSAEETTQAAPAETTAAPAQAAGDTNTATADKNNADTGIEGVAAVAGLAVLAAGAVVIAKKRK